MVRLLGFEKSTRRNKKYAGILSNGKKVHFGDSRFGQYRDRTGLGLYSSKDTMDPDKREAYKSRHSRILNEFGIPFAEIKFTPAWFSMNYLW